MKLLKNIILGQILLILGGCITQFIPELSENVEMLVVEGMLTDQPGGAKVKLSRSLPLGSQDDALPVWGCSVWLTDDLTNTIFFSELGNGVYTSDFVGEIGKKYVLHINTNTAMQRGNSYQSYPMELKPVPPVDSIYYEKKLMKTGGGSYSYEWEGCQVLLDAHDPSNECRFFRWDFVETWEVRVPFDKALNKICWITDNSREINIKSTAGLSGSVVSRYPVNFISNKTDRMKTKYSMLIDQYSLTEDEFIYWEKLKAVSQEVGSLYDITPAAIPNNIYCINSPAEKVLGYFSVSAKKSARVFIRDSFKGVPNMYSHADCIQDTIRDTNPIEGLNEYVWILESDMGPCQICPYRVITNIRGCADCTVRGTNIKPLFWQ